MLCAGGGYPPATPLTPVGHHEEPYRQGGTTYAASPYPPVPGGLPHPPYPVGPQPQTPSPYATLSAPHPAGQVDRRGRGGGAAGTPRAVASPSYAGPPKDPAVAAAIAINKRITAASHAQEILDIVEHVSAACHPPEWGLGSGQLSRTRHAFSCCLLECHAWERAGEASCAQPFFATGALVAAACSVLPVACLPWCVRAGTASMSMHSSAYACPWSLPCRSMRCSTPCAWPQRCTGWPTCGGRPTCMHRSCRHLSSTGSSS